MNHSTRAPTKYEAERIEAMKKHGCVACAVLGVPNLNELELHHILDGGKRMGHYFSIFLCAGHHQGRWTEGQLDWIEPKQRFAISDGRKRFNAIYGTERLLWERVQKKLELPLIWPVSKRVPRRGHHVEVTGSDPDPIQALLRETPTPTFLPRSAGEADRARQGSEAVTAVAGEEP